MYLFCLKSYIFFIDPWPNNIRYYPHLIPLNDSLCWKLRLFFFKLSSQPLIEYDGAADDGREIFVQLLLTLMAGKDVVADAFIVDDADADGRERVT